MDTAIVLFTRDLRVHDHPALAAASARAARLVPLFVLDPAVVARSARNRVAYLVEALAELRGSLRALGGDLVLRRGDTVEQTLRMQRETRAAAVFLASDVSALAAGRLRRLREGAGGAEVAEFPGVTVVPPGELRPAGGDHYKVFTPYWRAWESAPRRAPAEPPGRPDLPDGLEAGELPGEEEAARGTGSLSPERMRGGEHRARKRMRDWLSGGLPDYETARDDLAVSATSRLSADLRFGCLSPLELASAARERPGGAAYVRQLAWRDFHHQVAAAFPELPRRDYRYRDRRWNDDEDALAAWAAGETGVPIVDAGMRQLRHEGFMHNRARLITAVFLTRVLGVHWRPGADHFHRLLCDGDIADNYGNWQWVAGTGNDTRPDRRFNLLRQSRRFDPEGHYIRRHVAELADAGPGSVHRPQGKERPAGYPPPLAEPW